MLSYKWLLLSSSNVPKNFGPDNSVHPIWVTGMFRSGTSLVTKILKELGGDLGPEEDLLQPFGTRKHLNPDGFYENHLFMEWSMYAFFKNEPTWAPATNRR